MSSRPSFPVGRSLRAAVACLAFAIPLGLAASAHAAVTKHVYFNIGTYPAGFTSHNQQPRPAGAYYDGSYYQTSGPYVPTRVEQVRGGAVVVPTPAAPVTVEVGDVFRVVDAKTGATLAQTTFDGNPQFLSTSCIGQNGFSGTRAADATVTVQKIAPPPLRSSPDYVVLSQDRYRPGRVRSLGDGLFGGVFETAIGAGEFLQATQTTDTFTADTETTVTTTVTRAAGACPPPVPDTTGPKITSFDLGSPALTIAQYLKFGLTSFVGTSEPGTISEAIYLSNGTKLPASAAKRAKQPKPRLVLLGSGKATASVAGVTKVVVKPSKAARRALRGQRRVKVVLITSVRDLAGNVTNRPAVKITLKDR